MKKSLIFQWFSALWTGVSTQKQGVASIQKSALFYTFLGADLHKNKGSSTQNLSPYLHKKRGAREPNIHAGVDVSTQILQAEHPFDVIFSKTDVCSRFVSITKRIPSGAAISRHRSSRGAKRDRFCCFGLTALIYQYLYGYFTSHRFCVDRPRFLCRYPDFSDVKLFCHTSIENACFVAGFALSPFSPKIALKNAKKEPCQPAGLFLDFIHPLRVLRSSLLSGWAGY